MKKVFIIIAFIGSLAGCKKFDDINISPVLLTEAKTRALLTNAQQSIPGLTMGNDAAGRLGALYVQHLAEGPYPGSSLYSDRTLNFANFYIGPLYNLQTIINYNNDGRPEAENNGSTNNQIAVARILKAYYFLLMTDKWGDIPYSEALQGDANFAAKYDRQEDIYADLFKELTEAVAQINEGEQPVQGDILLNGNMAAWKRFANTQRMVMALRLSEVDPAKGKTEYAAALAAGVISSNAQNIAYQFVAGDPNNFNPWYNNYDISFRNDYAISNTLVDYMKPKNDPRLPIYGEVLGGEVIGLPYGRVQAVQIPATYSRIGYYFRSEDSELSMFTYAQVLFMEAEAAKIGYTAGGDAEAEAKYLAAIRASMEQYGVYSAAAYDAYIALPEVEYTPATAIERIITEKWVHSYLNSWETWSDWRRTGYPELTPAQDATDSRGIPLRIGYPSAEAALNKKNYEEAVSRLDGGKDENYSKMWWMP